MPEETNVPSTAAPTNFFSKFALGEIAYFEADINKIDGSGDATPTAVPCKIMAVKFTPQKVLYDIALKDDQGGFYEVLPLTNVDSYFVLSMPAVAVMEEEAA